MRLKKGCDEVLPHALSNGFHQPIASSITIYRCQFLKPVLIRKDMTKIIIELEEEDFMELLSTLTEIKDTLIRVENILAVNHSIADKEPETEKRIRRK
jgi:hypothetical protein